MNMFAKKALNKKTKVFVIHIYSSAVMITIYLVIKAEISLLSIEKFIIWAEYLIFAKMFLK